MKFKLGKYYVVKYNHQYYTTVGSSRGRLVDTLIPEVVFNYVDVFRLIRTLNDNDLTITEIVEVRKPTIPEWEEVTG